MLRKLKKSVGWPSEQHVNWTDCWVLFCFASRLFRMWKSKLRKLKIDVVPIPVRNCELYPGRLNPLPPFPRIGEQMRRPTRQRWSSPQRTVHRFAQVCLITSSLETFLDLLYDYISNFAGFFFEIFTEKNTGRRHWFRPAPAEQSIFEFSDTYQKICTVITT